MAETVRIMPKQPIEAEARPGHFDDGESHYSINLGLQVGVSSADWHEVSDPIVWDYLNDPDVLGTLARINDALPPGWEAKVGGHGRWLALEWLFSEDPDCGYIQVFNGCRIQPVGDSFAILPPEVKP